MAASLWSSKTADTWIDTQQRYDSILEKHASSKLQEVNSWYETELPKSISDRHPNRHITQPELVQLVDWKLTRGKWRPRLLDFAKAAAEQQVIEASTAAFAQLGSSSSSSSNQEAAAAAAADSSETPNPPARKKAKIATATSCPNTSDGDHKLPPPPAAAAVPDLSTVKSSLERLTVLKGVGAATASALLAAVDGSCPFMADQALEAALGKRDYTVKSYLQLVEALREKAAWLNSQDTGRHWTAVLVERCLYAADLQHKASPTSAAAAGATKPSKKRKSK